MANDIDNRVINITTELYNGGGYIQAHNILTSMMINLRGNSQYNIDSCAVLTDISQIINGYINIIKRDCILQPYQAQYLLKKNRSYVCINNEQKYV